MLIILCMLRRLLFEKNARYWAITAPWDHVMMGKSHSITQANHGKAHALKRMKEGDWIVYYSPKMSFSTNWKCQRFTAMARVLDDEIFQVQLSNGFAPFRRRVEFIPCREVHIKPLIPLLSFIKNKESWGFSFKFGVIEIPQEDFSIIAKNMLETPNRTHSRGGAFLG